MDIEVSEDSGAEDIWISRHELTKVGLETSALSDLDDQFKGAGGQVFKAQGKVTICLTGEMNQSLPLQCLVAPNESPLNGIAFGRSFIEKHGHLDRNNLFSEKKGTRDQRVVVSDPPKVGPRLSE